MNPPHNGLFERSTLNDLEAAAKQGLEALNSYPDEGYYDNVGFEGPGESSNPFGVLKYLLESAESPSKTENGARAFFSSEELGDNPILEQFSSLDSFLNTVEELDFYMENSLGYEEGCGPENPERLEEYRLEAEAVYDTIGGFYRVLI